jgi:hypothetical protein
VHIAYFITSHGYGHGVRATAIANCFSTDIQITFRTQLPELSFLKTQQAVFRMETRYDCGCLQTDGVTVDVEATLNCYRKIAHKNRENLQKEIRWCHEQEVDLIVSDITPFAFEIAKYSNIPSVAVTNFTWYDIYAQYLSSFPSFKPYLEEILRQYTYADLLIALQPSLDMNFFRKKTEVPVTDESGEIEKMMSYPFMESTRTRSWGLYTPVNRHEQRRLAEIEQLLRLGIPGTLQITHKSF